MTADHNTALAYLILALSWVVFVIEWRRQQKELGALRLQWLQVPASPASEAEEEDEMADEITSDQYVLPLEQRYPELTEKLRALALQLVMAKGRITSADIWAHLEKFDRATCEQAKKAGNGKILAVCFRQKDWVQTGNFPRLGSHGRRIAEWTLRQLRDREAA